MLMHFACPAVLVTTLTAQGPPAEDPDAALKSLLETPIVVGSSKAVGILGAPSTVSVLDRELLKRFGIRTLGEALEMVAGLELKRTYLKREVLTARGLLQDNYASKVLVLVDGVPVWHGSTGEAEPYRVSLDDLERVEVLRGPASVLYGSNAFVGAVNLVLRRHPGHLVRAGVDSRGGHEAGLSSVITRGAWQLVAGLSSSRQEGRAIPFQDERGITRPFEDRLQARTATLSLSRGGQRLLFNAYRGEEGYLGNTPQWATGTNAGGGIGNLHRTSGRLFAYTMDQPLSATLRLMGGLSLDWQDRNLSRREDDTRRSNVEAQRESANLKAVWQARPNLELEGGLDYDRRKSWEYTDMSPVTGQLFNDFQMRGVSVCERSAFFQGTFEAAPYRVLVGTRTTRNERAGSNTSSRVTAVRDLGPRSSVKLIAGQSFRAPTLFELFFTSGTTVLGNPDLQPERAQSVELAYLLAHRGWFLQALVYQARYQDKITRVTVPGSDATKYVNGTAFESSGLELEAKVATPVGFAVFLSLDMLLRTTEGDAYPAGSTHANFHYTPRQHVSGGLALPLGPLDLGLTGQWESRAKGPSGELGSQATLSLNLGYRHLVGNLVLEHDLRLSNATDRLRMTPEFVRRSGVNAVPLDGFGRRLEYTLRVPW